MGVLIKQIPTELRKLEVATDRLSLSVIGKFVYKPSENDTITGYEIE